MKLLLLRIKTKRGGRPFTGAWIETPALLNGWQGHDRRPFTGAWIETTGWATRWCLPASPLHGGVD